MNADQITGALEELAETWRYQPLTPPQADLWRTHLRDVNRKEFAQAIAHFVRQGNLRRPDVPTFMAQVRKQRPSIADTTTSEPWHEPEPGAIADRIAELRRLNREALAHRRRTRRAAS